MHLNWCGRCECIEQNYRTLGAKHDDRVAFWSCSEDYIPEDLKTNLQHGPLTCKPRFVVYIVSYSSSTESVPQAKTNEISLGWGMQGRN